MDRRLKKSFAEKAVALGRTGDPSALPALIELLKMPSSQIRKLSVSAIGKLAGLVNAETAVSAIMPVLHNPKPQNRQYTIKAISAYGIHANNTLHDLQDIADNPAEKTETLSTGREKADISLLF